MASLAFFFMGAGAVSHALCMALLKERLEVEMLGGRYRLTRELHGLRGGVSNCIGETFIGSRGAVSREGAVTDKGAALAGGAGLPWLRLQ
jgi:hypothetical protein